jgi:hypothetical protein
MRTPAGTDCKYFYGDYYRGRSREECRLLGPQWQPALCRSCPVPGILRANACEYMELSARVSRSLWTAFRPRILVDAFCRKAERSVAEPHVGCGECHPLPPAFEIKK